MTNIERKLLQIDKGSNVIAAGLVFDYRLAVHHAGLLAVSEAMRELLLPSLDASYFLAGVLETLDDIEG